MNRLIYLLILIFPFITNAQVVTNGLVLHVDANDPNSYSGSGNTWTDLTGNANNIILNGPTFRSTNETVEKYFEFDGTDDRGAIENLNYGSNYTLTEFSVFTWMKTSYNDGTEGVWDNLNWSLVDFDRSEQYNLTITGR